MIPRTLSASSLQVWALCPARWVAEYMHRTPNFDNNAALVGTTVHGALEKLVKAVFIDKTHADLNRVKQKELLITFYQMSYIETFGSADFETAEYKDGFALAMEWFRRTDLGAKEMIGVETVEVKETIKIPYNHPDGSAHTCNKCDGAGLPSGQCQVDFNYLMDRVDQIDNETWEVVDYKSIRVPITPQELEDKLQARAYALAIQIKHPEAKLIKVTFDLLRHEPVSIFVTRDQNIAFWRFLCAETQEIVNRMEEDARPRLNTECGYCVIKATCPLMQKNVAAGGILGISVDEAPAMISQLKDQMKANKLLVEQLEDIIYQHAADTDSLSWETPDGAYEVEIKSSRRRQFDSHRAAEIMGPEKFASMGSMTLGSLEAVIKDPATPDEMRNELKALIGWTNGNLGMSIKPKTTF